MFYITQHPDRTIKTENPILRSPKRILISSQVLTWKDDRSHSLAKQGLVMIGQTLHSWASLIRTEAQTAASKIFYQILYLIIDEFFHVDIRNTRHARSCFEQIQKRVHKCPRCRVTFGGIKGMNRELFNVRSCGEGSVWAVHGEMRDAGGDAVLPTGDGPFRPNCLWPLTFQLSRSAVTLVCFEISREESISSRAGDVMADDWGLNVNWSAQTSII